MNGFLIDLHCHTKEHSPDGLVPAAEIVHRLLEAGFSGLVLTDHSYVWPDEELAEFRVEHRIPEDFLLLSGQEVHTAVQMVSYGDLLVFGPRQNLADFETPPELVIELVKRAGGFTIAPHAAVPKQGFGEHVGDYPITAVEAWNGRYGPAVAARSRELAIRFDLPQVGGSDTHRPADIAGGGTLFEERPGSLADLRRMILSGACAPWKPGLLNRASRWLRREGD